MSTIALTIAPGNYYAGIKRPWYATQSRVKKEVTALGLSNVQIRPRAGASFPVNPRLDPGYSDNWDELITGSYSGAPKTVRADRVWAWLVAVPPTAGGNPPVPVVPGGLSASKIAPEWQRPDDYPGTGLGLVLIPVSAVAAWFALRKR